MGHRLRPTLAFALTTSLLVAVATSAQDPFFGVRQRMVQEQVQGRGVTQPTLLSAMETVPRHLFVPEESRSFAYEDRSLSIGAGEFMSRPYLSARMIELLELDGTEKVLEIGTGSGYDAALLSRLAAKVFTIELLDELGTRASKNLEYLGFSNVRVRVGNGYEGWPEEAPFDAIILTAAPEHLPASLLAQLKESGRMVVPVGRYVQDLQVITKTAGGTEKRTIIPVHLGPMHN